MTTREKLLPQKFWSTVKIEINVEISTFRYLTKRAIVHKHDRKPDVMNDRSKGGQSKNY